MERITIKEASARLKRSERTVRKLILSERLTVYRFSPRGKILLDWDEIDGMLEARKEQARANEGAKAILEALFA
jgi:excisionase family DNA binding protein